MVLTVCSLFILFEVISHWNYLIAAVFILQCLSDMADF